MGIGQLSVPYKNPAGRSPTFGAEAVEWWRPPGLAVAAPALGAEVTPRISAEAPKAAISLAGRRRCLLFISLPACLGLDPLVPVWVTKITFRQRHLT
jgi:hypothetical protein